MRTHVDLKFADGEYRFALGLAQIDELQEKTGIGIGGLYARVLQGRVADGEQTVGHPAYSAFRFADLRQTIRQGLIGGGEGIVDEQPVTVTALRANDLVARYCYPHMPLVDEWNLAAAILFAAVEGYEPEPDEAPPAGEEADGAAEKKSPTVDSITPAP